MVFIYNFYKVKKKNICNFRILIDRLVSNILGNSFSKYIFFLNRDIIVFSKCVFWGLCFSVKYVYDGYFCLFSCRRGGSLSVMCIKFRCFNFSLFGYMFYLMVNCIGIYSMMRFMIS